MTKAAAIQAFFSQFLTAYEENSVYDMDEPPEFPYLTYQLITGAFDPESNGTSVSVSLWYRSESWLAINAKVEEISKTVGRHGVLLRCDGGRILIRRSDTNFAQSMGDPSDDRVKRKILSLTMEYFTND
jgi:hypothetical protein